MARFSLDRRAGKMVKHMKLRIVQFRSFLCRLNFRSVRRLMIAVVGVAMLGLPGPAILVIPLGLAILETEFFGARRWLQRAKELLNQKQARVTGNAGLSAAEVTRRRKTSGSNHVTTRRGTPPRVKFLRQFNQPLGDWHADWWIYIAIDSNLRTWPVALPSSDCRG